MLLLWLLVLLAMWCGGPWVLVNIVLGRFHVGVGVDVDDVTRALLHN